MLVREGLQRLEGVESVGERANHKTQTCEVRTRSGRLLSHDTLIKHILDMRVGARLRGIEATVDGWVERRGSNAVLKVSGTNEILRLASLQHIVQWDMKNHCPQQPSVDEVNALKDLLAAVKDTSPRVLITGPVVRDESASEPILEVRRFEYVASR